MEKVNPVAIDQTPVERPKNAEPWRQVSLSGVATIVVASTLPIAIGLFAMLLGLKFELALLLVFLPTQLVLGVIAGRKFSGRRGQADAILQVFVVFFAMTVVVLLISVVWSVIERGSAAISWQFITQNNVYISGSTSLEYGGLGHAIIGTLLIVALSTIVTVPLGIATAIYLTETRGRTRSTIRTLIQALSGLPSVVAGLFIYAMFIASGLTQYVGWAGSLALIPLMLPTVTRVAEESLLLVPQELRNGALALGSSAWRAFYLVTMPAAKSGLITAILLGIARIIGETAPLLITTFAANNTNYNPFNGSISTLPTYLYTFIASNFDTAVQRAWGAALVILILVAILFIAARLLTRQKTAKKAGK
ncbi:MAG: phosphate ABC transporter permease PstA [Rhodoluna sp.]|nr:phosphate ABC transporter permease PstA [Rhodoluna sp.]